MVAMCAWRNENVERNPDVWSWFEPQRVQWCEVKESSLEYSMWDVFYSWTQRGFVWPSPSLASETI